MKRTTATTAALAATIAFGIATAPAAAAATIVGSTFARCNPVDKGHNVDHNIRGEQTYYRTANPNGKILDYTATPTKTIRRTGLPDIRYEWVRAELIRANNPTLIDYRSDGQFGQLSAPAGPAATTTKFGWRKYVGGQLVESLWCSISTPAQS